MITQEGTLKQNSVISLTDRRAFLKLPLEERRRILKIQAERMLQHHDRESESGDREAWQGGDIVEL